MQYFSGLPREQQDLIRQSKLLIYICEGEEREVKEWFKTINIVGIPLNEQELRNAIYSGPFGQMRAVDEGEVCALQWVDVDLAHRMIRVRQSAGRIYNCDLKATEFILSTPKTKHSFREIPISGQLFEALRAVKKLPPSIFVVGGTEQATDPRSYRDYFARLLRRLQIPHMAFHGLRHTFATRCIESQCDYKTVSTLLGHSNVATTLNLYVHPNLQQKKRCIDRMSRLIAV